jgi:hypothetical protein
MTIAMKRVIAALLAPIAIFGFALTAFTESAIADGTSQQEANGGQELTTQATEISTDVRPWCGWTALAATTSAIVLRPVSGQDAMYDGGEIALAANGKEFAIKVGPVRSSPVEAGVEFEEEESDNCSWFRDDQKNGVEVTTTLDHNNFVGKSSKNTGAAEDDTSMNFDAEENNNFTIANTADEGSCTNFSFISPPLVVDDILTATTGASVVTLGAEATSTNNFCSWKSDYSIKIPAGMTPLFGDSTYTFEGPTITNTMVYSRAVVVVVE